MAVGTLAHNAALLSLPSGRALQPIHHWPALVRIRRPSQPRPRRENTAPLAGSPVKPQITKAEVSATSFDPINPVTLVVKYAGKRSAGNPHATCDAVGGGIGGLGSISDLPRQFPTLPGSNFMGGLLGDT
jgi:hypothetical protein